MNLCNCPPEAWLLALQCVGSVMTHTGEKSLGNQPPLQILEGFTIDISILLYFLFWDIVYVSRVEDNECHRQIRSRKSSLVRGRMVSFTWNVGHGLQLHARPLLTTPNKSSVVLDCTWPHTQKTK